MRREGPRAGGARPAATYRLQLGPECGFRRARSLLPYLHALGVSTLYVSPVLQSVRGGHGYDVTDPRRPNDELGTHEQLRELCEAAAGLGLDLLVDIVPNHMAASLENPFWRDVIEKGRASRYADMFAIDWEAPAAEGRLVLPVLPAPAEELLASGGVSLELDEARGELLIVAGALRLPLSPWSYAGVLGEAALEVEPPAPPGDTSPQARDALADVTETLKLTLARTLRSSASTAAEAHLRVAAFNAHAQRSARAAGEARSRLSDLLESQPYRLLWWRHGLKVVNYRRFFDIADLVGVRQEAPGVFELTHGFLLELSTWPGVAGFRVDHIDGLRDPLAYLTRLREAVGDACILVEKILAEGETLPADWPVDGTTGYEFGADVDRLLVDPFGWARLRDVAERFTGASLPAFERLSRRAKREVLRSLFEGEVATLARRLPRDLASPARPSAGPRRVRPEHRTSAIVDLTAALPVYRTYYSPAGAPAASSRALGEAAAAMEREWPAAEGSADHEARAEVLRTIELSSEDPRALGWTQDWQQLTGAAAAKGVEDTALYRYPVLLSRNEVGADPALPPLTAAAFHARMRRRWSTPGSLNTTSTHDSKHDEDARARLDALSAHVADWSSLLDRWRRLNEDHRVTIGGRDVPGSAEELLLYQSLLAMWPLARSEERDAVDRLCAYVVKALREAKLETSWLSPDEDHEGAVTSFVRSVLAPGNSAFLDEVRQQAAWLAAAGAVGSLALTLLRVTAPGVPDTYQGTELWTSPRLVDPDNRAPTDFALRQRLLAEMDEREMTSARLTSAGTRRESPPRGRDRGGRRAGAKPCSRSSSPAGPTGASSSSS